MKKITIIDMYSENEFEYEDFLDVFQYELDKTRIKNGVVLFGYSIRWNGSDGVAHVSRKKASDIMYKLSGFDASLIELYKDRHNLVIKLYNHDRPTGCLFYIKADTPYVNNGNFLEEKALNSL